MEIKIKLNDIDYIIVEDIHNGGINFRMYSKSLMPWDKDDKVFHNGFTQRMGIALPYLSKFISSLQDIRKMMNSKHTSILFKEGDILYRKDGLDMGFEIESIDDDFYRLKCGLTLPFSEQEKWEIRKNNN